MSFSIIKHDRVRLEQSEDAPAAALPARADAGPRSLSRCKKSVQLLREKDMVRAIEVRCSCGELTVVELEYDPN
jgi:hypothetical protein